MEEEDRRILEKTPWMRRLTEGERQAVFRRFRVRRFGADAVIFWEGEPTDGAAVLLTGAVKVVRETSEGKERTIEILGAGATAGIVGLFDGGPYPATVIALSPVRLAVLSRTDAEELMAAFPPICLSFLQVLSHRLRVFQEEMAFSPLATGHGRAAHALLRLAAAHGTLREDGIRIDLRLTQQELAQYAGLARESMSRILQDFVREGSILLESRHVVLLSPERLEAWGFPMEGGRREDV